MWTVQNGFFDDVPVEQVRECQAQLADFLTTRKDRLAGEDRREKKLEDALIADLKAAAAQFKQTWKPA